MREEVIRDIKTVGKELAFDIVSLNKKIEQRSAANVQRIKAVEANYDKFEKRTTKLLKQYNSIHHQMRKIEGSKVTDGELKPNRRSVSVHRTIDSVQRRSNNASMVEQQSAKARSNSCSLRKKSRPHSNNGSRLQFTS